MRIGQWLSSRLFRSVISTPRFLQDLRLAHADGSYPKLLAACLVLIWFIFDDWMRDTFNFGHSLKICWIILDESLWAFFDEIVTQIPVDEWHERIPDPTIGCPIWIRLLKIPTGSNFQASRKDACDLLYPCRPPDYNHHTSSASPLPAESIGIGGRIIGMRTQTPASVPKIHFWDQKCCKLGPMINSGIKYTELRTSSFLINMPILWSHLANCNSGSSRSECLLSYLLGGFPMETKRIPHILLHCILDYNIFNRVFPPYPGLCNMLRNMQVTSPEPIPWRNWYLDYIPVLNQFKTNCHNACIFFVTQYVKELFFSTIYKRFCF